MQKLTLNTFQISNLNRQSACKTISPLNQVSISLERNKLKEELTLVETEIISFAQDGGGK